MAITIDYVILPHLKKDDGTNFIRLRITHKRKSKYIKTNIVVELSDLTRSGNLKNQGKIDLAGDEVKKWRKVVSAMTTSAADAMNVDEVVQYVKARLQEEEGFRLDFVSYGLEKIETMKASTAHNYRVALRTLVRYFGHNPDISEITVRSMRGFEEFIRKEPRMVYYINKGIIKESKKAKGDRVVSMYIGNIRAIYNRARLEFNEPDRKYFPLPIDIFEYYKVPKTPVVEHRDIPADWVQMMIDQRKGLRGRERLGVDVFLLSFTLMGVNAVDMYEMKEKPADGVLHYYRTKTTDAKADKAEMYVRIEPQARELMSDYLGRGHVFDFSTRYATRLNFTVAINKGLRQWIERNKLKDFTFYSARHTWATLGASKQVGVDVAMITEGLSHSDASRKMDMVYIRKDWEKVWEANAKVLGLFRW
jgi:integrase